MGTVVNPAPQFGSLLAQFVLNVDFLLLIAGPGQVDAAQHAFFDVALPLHLIEEIFSKVRVAEEQPVLTLCAFRRALLHKRAERRDAGTGTNHDHRRFRVRRQTEVIVMLDKNANFAVFFDAVGQETGSAAGTSATFNIITHYANGDVDFAFHFRLRRGDRVEPRRQRAQQVNQRLGIQLRRRETHHVDDRRGCGVVLKLCLIAHQRQ